MLIEIINLLMLKQQLGYIKTFTNEFNIFLGPIFFNNSKGKRGRKIKLHTGDVFDIIT